MEYSVWITVRYRIKQEPLATSNYTKRNRTNWLFMELHIIWKYMWHLPDQVELIFAACKSHVTKQAVIVWGEVRAQQQSHKTTFFVFYSSDVYAVRKFVDSAMDVFIVHVCFKPQTGQTKFKKSLYVNFSSLHNFKSMAHSLK